MALTAANLVDRMARALDDAGHRNWSEAEALEYLSDAQRATVMLRPDTNPDVRSVSLAPGTRQTIPDDAFSLLDVIRNTGVGGGTPGRAITPTNWDDLNDSDPDWHTATNNVVDEYVYDAEKARGWYYVSPGQPSPSSHQIEIVIAKIPAEITLTATALELSDAYQPVLLDYMLHRAYSKLTNTAGSANYISLAAGHYQKFTQMLLGHKQSEMEQDPLTKAAQVVGQ